jgi:hypothetical protein
MHNIRLHHAAYAAAALLLFALGLSLLAPRSAEALNNRQQLLLGGNSTTQNSTRYTSPGFGNQFTADFPSTGLGEAAASARMVGGGVLSSLWVRIYTQTVPSSGSFTVTVRINGAPTTLTCTLFGTGQCQSGAASVNIANGARLAVEVTNDFVNSGNVTYAYSLLLD